MVVYFYCVGLGNFLYIIISLQNIIFVLLGLETQFSALKKKICFNEATEKKARDLTRARCVAY